MCTEIQCISRGDGGKEIFKEIFERKIIRGILELKKIINKRSLYKRQYQTEVNENIEENIALKKVMKCKHKHILCWCIILYYQLWTPPYMLLTA